MKKKKKKKKKKKEVDDDLVLQTPIKTVYFLSKSDNYSSSVTRDMKIC